MTARLRSWWQQIKQHPVTTVLIALFVALSVIIIVGGYKFNWDWTGFNHPSRTLWDWLQLLGVVAIPIVVGFGAVWFTAQQNHDREIAEMQRVADRELTVDNQREAILQSFLDKMTELLLHENLSKSQRNDVVANIAQTRTLITLSNLDSLRKGYIIIFLAASGLINRQGNIIDLSVADLRGVNLRHTQKLDGISLEGANLAWADLTGAVLSDVKFQGANLRRANLSETDLRGADFNYADLSDAILSGANVSLEQLEEAESLKGATMLDGSIHP